MNPKRLGARIGAVSVAATFLMSGMSYQANATGTYVDSWNTSTAPVRCGGTGFCLYYSPGAGGAIWSSGETVSNLSGHTFRNDGHGSTGAGQQVRNNAASAENASPACSMRIYVYPDYVGDYNALSPGKGGNLTAGLRNNEASVGAFCVNSCPTSPSGWPVTNDGPPGHTLTRRNV